MAMGTPCPHHSRRYNWRDKTQNEHCHDRNPTSIGQLFMTFDSTPSLVLLSTMIPAALDGGAVAPPPRPR
eukprot:9470317-Pyramimonas_sp.AAC.1